RDQDVADAAGGGGVHRGCRPVARRRGGRSGAVGNRGAKTRMISLRQVARAVRIAQVLVKYGLDELIRTTHLFRPLPFVLYAPAWHWTRRDRLPRGQRIRLALQELGPIFVKFGQMLSTRPDVVPADIATELTLLQDRVEPFPGALARAEIERALGQPVTALFSEFDETALASASIAQVHPAFMHDGTRVVVKVLRPDIERLIRDD